MSLEPRHQNKSCSDFFNYQDYVFIILVPCTLQSRGLSICSEILALVQNQKLLRITVIIGPEALEH